MTKADVFPWLALVVCLFEGYYWLVYVPKARRTPGMNRELDDVRFYLKTVSSWRERGLLDE